MVARDNHPPTKREIEQRRCARKLKLAAGHLKDAHTAVQKADTERIVLHVKDAMVELIHLGDVLDVNLIGEVFGQLKKLDRLETPPPVPEGN